MSMPRSSSDNAAASASASFPALSSKGDADAIAQEWAGRDPDVRLMLEVRSDEPGAFERLVRKYQNRLLTILTHLVGSREEAEDLTQDVFLRIYKARKGYKPRAKFSTWLFTIANNLALNHMRTKGRRPTVSLGTNDESGSLGGVSMVQAVARDGTPSAQMRQVELAQVVQHAVNTLGEDQRLAILLSKFEEMSYAEIGEIMTKSEAAVKSLLARARMNLRDQLEPYLRTDFSGTIASTKEA